MRHTETCPTELLVPEHAWVQEDHKFQHQYHVDAWPDLLPYLILAGAVALWHFLTTCPSFSHVLLGHEYSPTN
ncbi:hypothetical protein CC2G_005254 [Coprinopsis cinerea AmutBmut pab1-1]|nr:hypothetical protein CC2G_005254 [Coprinopsis cinerea AmutBmut pab1-1]